MFETENEILRNELQEIDFILNMMEEFSELESVLGTMLTAMVTYNLTKYYILLLIDYVEELKVENYLVKYKQLKKLEWKDFWKSESFI